jgi:KUP system potassium uptake protein
MGHFGRRPIQLAWTGLVLPALALNYLGQGALLMADPSAIENPFYRLFPDAWVLPAVVLATLAAIIASQAVISGAYSVTRQAIQLGFLPRMTVRHTSAREAGQIYMPAVNWALLGRRGRRGAGFGSSSALAGAYGIAVTLTMLITTLLTFFVVRQSWRLPAPLALGATGFFLPSTLLVASCASSCSTAAGSRWPGPGLFTLMSTWARGRAQMLAASAATGWRWQPSSSLDPSDLQRAWPHRGLCRGRPRDGAAGAAAQPEAQPGAARAQRDPDRGLPRGALGAAVRARQVQPLGTASGA